MDSEDIIDFTGEDTGEGGAEPLSVVLNSSASSAFLNIKLNILEDMGSIIWRNWGNLDEDFDSSTFILTDIQ